MQIKRIDGKKFGRWVVIEPCETPKNHKTAGQYWLCQCDCGAKEVINGARLRAGRMKRGCLNCSGRTHKKGGKGASPTYGSWRAMRSRCLDKNSIAYPAYGGSGIIICERWKHSFINFLNDMGERPKGKTLDRIDSKLGYFPENCRWATTKEQARNKESFKLSDEAVAEIIKCHKKYGITQLELSVISGVARSHIANILRGHSRNV